MKVHLCANDQHGTRWLQRSLDCLRQALRHLQWRIAQVKTLFEDISAARAGVEKRGSFVVTLRGADRVAGTAANRWFEHQPQALALIPVRIAGQRPIPQGHRRQRHE